MHSPPWPSSATRPPRRRLVWFLLSLALGPGPSALGLDPHKAITQYAHQVWKTDQGLPQNSIQAILQTRDGYIWLGTERGLVRFDGVQFTVFDKGNSPGLLNSNAQALYQSKDGALWIGTWGGLHRYKDGRFTAYTAREGLGSNRVLSICRGPGRRALARHGRGRTLAAQGREDHDAERPRRALQRSHLGIGAGP